MTELETKRRWLFAIYCALFALLAVWAAIEPFDRKDWALENLLVVVAFAFMVGSYRVLPLSRVSYTLIFVFLCLHEIGSHYTYAEVPYDAWTRDWFGVGFNDWFGWDRNNYDRIVHFAYGLLLAYPVREVFLRFGDIKGFWGYFLPLDLTMSTSMLYELIEWGAAEVVGGDLGVAYLGTQGDVWDAQKDMGLASLGALLAMLLTYAINRRTQHDFAREWAQSVRLRRAARP